MMNMADTTDQFLRKLETFAGELDAYEQGLLHYLLMANDDHEVSGFGFSRAPVDAVVSGPIPIPFADLRAKIDAFTAPGEIAGVMAANQANARSEFRV